MSAPVDEEAMRQEFERLAAMDPLIGVSNAAGYGLLLLKRESESQKLIADLKAKLQDLLVRFIAIGGMQWDNLPLIPVTPPKPPQPPQPPVEPLVGG